MARKSGAQDGVGKAQGSVRFYALLSLGCFVCALVLIFLMLSKADFLTSLGLVGSFYYLALLPLGLCVAVFLFGVLRSFARYGGHHLGGYVELGGPIVAFMLVVICGFWLPPPASNFLLTIYVHGELGNSDMPLRNSGYVLLHFGASPRREPIGSEGQAIFAEIPASFRRQKVNVFLDSDAFELCEVNQQITLAAPSIYLCVRKKPGHVSGQIRDEEGKPVFGANVNIAGITVRTDAGGHFQMLISADKMQPEVLLQASAAGFATGHSTVVPNANEATIILKRQP